MVHGGRGMAAECTGSPILAGVSYHRHLYVIVSLSVGQQKIMKIKYCFFKGRPSGALAHF